VAKEPHFVDWDGGKIAFTAEIAAATIPQRDQIPNPAKLKILMDESEDNQR
jgi:hypothetical protein